MRSQPPPLTKRTLSLINEANRLATQRSMPWQRRALYTSIAFQLDLISSTGQWIAIPRIISLALDPRRGVAAPAARAIEKLRESVGLQNMRVLDRGFREFGPYTHPENTIWLEMKPAILERISTLRHGKAVLQYAMCHPSGHVREEAIRRCAKNMDGSEVPLLLLRANDWVKPVRELAQSTLRSWLRPENVRSLTVVLPLLERMRKWGRMGSFSLLDEVDDILTGPNATSLLLEILESSDKYARRGAYRCLAGVSHADPGPLFGNALQDDDPAIRAWAGHRLNGAEAKFFLAHSNVLLTNRLVPVRVGAVHRLVSLGHPLPWKKLLFDPHAQVRIVAQKIAREEGANPAIEYRARIPDHRGKSLCAAIVGLSETGGSEDVELIKTFLSAPEPRVRRSSLHALANLKTDNIVDLCFTSIQDQSPRVTHTARDLLLHRIGDIAPGELWTTFVATQTSWGKKNALCILANLGYWVRLPYLLKAFIETDSEVKARAAHYLTRWLLHQNRVFTNVPRNIAEQARDLLQNPSFSPSLRHEIEALLDCRRT